MSYLTGHLTALSCAPSLFSLIFGFNSLFVSCFYSQSSYLTGSLQILDENPFNDPCLFIRIDENSPLWEVSPIDLLTETFEIVLTMEGTTPETGNNIQVRTIILTFSLRHEIQNLIQVRTSYVPGEILWGYKFEHSCVHYDKHVGKYEVTFDTLNTIIKDDTPK